MRPITQPILGSILVLLILNPMFMPSATAGLPEPHMLIYGILQTSEGVPLTSGTLEFLFDPYGVGDPVPFEATLGEHAENVTFMVKVPIELGMVSPGHKALVLDGAYEVQILYNGEEIIPTGIENPLIAEAGRVIRNLTCVLYAQEAILAVSGDLEFGTLTPGTFEDRVITISNIGALPLDGTVRLQEGLHFKISVSGISVDELPFLIDPGESLDVTVRFWPLVVSPDLDDTLIVSTNVGMETRLVSGAAAEADIDGDNIPDALEAAVPSSAQTNMYLADSDGDGLSDGTEDSNRDGAWLEGVETRARDRDSDQDLWEDGIETLLVPSDPLNPGSPVPQFTDMDGDHLPDLIDPDDLTIDIDGDRIRDDLEATYLGIAAVSNPQMSPTYGDVDHNTVLDNGDGQLILSFFAGRAPQTFYHSDADATRDGIIDNADSQSVLNYFARIFETLPFGDR
jgi:hypothetical protein